MQKTRQQILEILNHRGHATVHEIVDELQRIRGDHITAVTVRHHLNLLQKRDLISSPEMRHKSKPGRPQHVYTLTEKAHQHFPSNYQQLTNNLIQEIRKHLPPTGVNVIFEGIADGMAAEADIPFEISILDRLELVVDYLDSQGYDAYWEETNNGFLLHTSNCPYHDIARSEEALCQMDMRLMSSLMGIVPRRLSRVSCGDSTCSYFFPSQ